MSTSTGTGQVDEEVRHARRDELISLQQDIGQNFAESLLGRQVSSLFLLVLLVLYFIAGLCRTLLVALSCASWLSCHAVNFQFQPPALSVNLFLVLMKLMGHAWFFCGESPIVWQEKCASHGGVMWG